MDTLRVKHSAVLDLVTTLLGESETFQAFERDCRKLCCRVNSNRFRAGRGAADETEPRETAGIKNHSVYIFAISPLPVSPVGVESGFPAVQAPS